MKWKPCVREKEMREGEGRGAVGSRFKGLRGGGRWMGDRGEKAQG